MKGQTEAVKLAIEVLTPVHVGSGQDLYLGLDYVDNNGQPFVVDQNRTFETIASGNAALDVLLRGTPDLTDLVRLASAYHGYTLPALNSRFPSLPQSLRECIKDAMLRPYIPGSSLKGSIRTALLAESLRRHWNKTLEKHLPVLDGKKVKPSFAADRLSKAVLGKNPNSDVLRALHVGDANFEAADLRLADIRWLNIVKWGDKEQAKWRDMPSKRSKDKWNEASGLHAEVLSPDSLAPVTLQWDRFLLSDTRRWDTPDHAEKLLPNDFTALADTLNKHARYLLNREIEFFDSFGQHKPKQQCADLLKRIEQDPEAAYLRLAWGSGWRGMTGDWQNHETAEAMRKLYKLGRTGAATFPKTRRLAVQGEPYLPLGWVRLLPWRENLRRRAASETTPTPTLGHPWVEEQLALIQKQHRCQAEEALRGQPLAKAWQALEDEDIKIAALDDIRSRWQKQKTDWWENPPGMAARKALAIYLGKGD